MSTTRINGKSDRHRSDPQRIGHTASDRLIRVLVIAMKQVMVIDLENQRNFPGKLSSPRFQKPEWRGISVATGFDGQTIVVKRIIGGRIRSEGTCRTVLETLINGQDDKFACSGEVAGIHQAGEIG